MPLLFTNDKHVQAILDDVIQKDDSEFGDDEDEKSKVAREEDDALYKWAGRTGPHRVTNQRDKQATDARHMASKDGKAVISMVMGGKKKKKKR